LWAGLFLVNGVFGRPRPCLLRFMNWPCLTLLARLREITRPDGSFGAAFLAPPQVISPTRARLQLQPAGSPHPAALLS
jgi:hypothetical protein